MDTNDEASRLKLVEMSRLKLIEMFGEPYSENSYTAAFSNPIFYIINLGKISATIHCVMEDGSRSFVECADFVKLSNEEALNLFRAISVQSIT